MTVVPRTEESSVEENFEFYGLTIAASSASAALIEEIRRNFSYFHTAPREAQVQIRVHFLPPPYDFLPTAPAFRFTLRSACFRDKHTIYLDYFGQGLAIFDQQTQRCDIYSTDLDQVQEIVYLFILFRVGQHLRHLGIHRVHALGVSYQQQGVLLLLPSGGGKSTMALELLRQPGFLLLSEDTPLVDRRGMLLPFPLRLSIMAHRPLEIPAQHLRTVRRMGFGPKTLIDLEYFRDRIAQSVAPRFLLVGQRNLGEVSEIVPLSRRQAFKALLQNLVVGQGVYQGREFLGQHGTLDFLDKGKVVAARLYNSLRLLSRVSPYRFTLGRNIERNSQTLIEFLQRTMNMPAVPP